MSSLTHDFLVATRDKRVVDHDKVINEASKNSYICLSRMMKSNSKKFKGGRKLVDQVIGKEGTTGGFYDPNKPFTLQNKDVLTQIEVNWAYHHRGYPLVDEQTDLNKGDSSRFVDLCMALESSAVVDAANDWEQALWALPDKRYMEDTAQQEHQRPFSIPAVITRDGLAPSSSNGGVAAGSGNWTTVQTVDPSTNAFWRNQNNTYAAATPTGVGGIITAFDTMIERVKFDNPDMTAQYINSPERQKRAIITSTDGVTTFKAALRAQNDRMERLNDPTISGPQFDGVPMMKASELDGYGWTTANADYFWVDFEYLVPFFHSSHFFAEKIAQGSIENPNKVGVFKFTWYNALCRSRRRMGRTYAA